MIHDTGRLRAALSLVLLTAGGASAQGLPECGSFPQDAVNYACTCAAGAPQGTVWGSWPYTADSNLCSAAVHAGVIGPDGGAVLAIRAEGQTAYVGSDRNGVASRDWGSYGVSYVFAPSGPKPTGAVPAGVEVCAARLPEGTDSQTCLCAPDAAAGSVWGSGPYTADSDMCTAARHAGIVGAGGGPIDVLRVGGLQTYRGSSHNGVESRDWGAYGASIVFDLNR